MIGVNNFPQIDPKQAANYGLFDEDKIITYVRYGNLVYLIDWSLYETLWDRVIDAFKIRWEGMAGLWIAGKKFRNAITGLRPVKGASRGDIAFQTFPQADPQPDLYNRGQFYGKHPNKDNEAFKTMFRTNEELENHIEEKGESGTYSAYKVYS